MSLSEKFYKGYGHNPVHLLNKCETCNKNRRESNAVTKSREALSFSAFLVIFFAFAKSDIIATAIVILKPCGFSGILFAMKLAKRIPLGASRISLRSNITRHRRIELAWYSDKSITPNGFLPFLSGLFQNASCIYGKNCCNFHIPRALPLRYEVLPHL